MIRIRLNGEEKNYPSPLFLQALLDDLHLTTSSIAVALNSQVIPRAEFSQTLIQDQDNLEILKPVGGG